MTEAEQERAAVVAWLKSERGRLVGYYRLTEGLADAIERGDHLRK